MAGGECDVLADLDGGPGSIGSTTYPAEPAFLPRVELPPHHP
jgi:hypothetical protein